MRGKINQFLSSKKFVSLILLLLFVVVFVSAVYQRGIFYNSDSIRYLSEAGFLGSKGHIGGPVSEFMRRPLHALMVAVPMFIFGANDNSPFIGNFVEMILIALAIYKICELIYKNSGVWGAFIYLFSGYSWAYGFSLMSEISSLLIVSWALYFAFYSLEKKKIWSWQSFLFILLMFLLPLTTSRWIIISFISVGIYELLFLTYGIGAKFAKLKDYLFHYLTAIGALLIAIGTGILIYYISAKHLFYIQTNGFGIDQSFIHSIITLTNDFGSTFVKDAENLLAFFKIAKMADNIILPILFVFGLVLLFLKLFKTKSVGLFYLLFFFVFNWVFFSFYHSDKIQTPLGAPRFFALILPVYYIVTGVILGFILKKQSILVQNMALIFIVLALALTNREYISTKLLKPILANNDSSQVFLYINNPTFSESSPVVLKNKNILSLNISAQSIKDLSKYNLDKVKYLVYQDFSAGEEFEKTFASKLPFFQEIEKFNPEKTVELPIKKTGKLIFLEHFSYQHEKNNSLYPEKLRLRFYKISDLIGSSSTLTRVLDDDLIVEGEDFDGIVGTCKYSIENSQKNPSNKLFNNECLKANYLFEVKDKGKYRLEMVTENDGGGFALPFVGVDNNFNIINTNYREEEYNLIGDYELEPGLHRIFSSIQYGEQLENGIFKVDYYKLSKIK